MQRRYHSYSDLPKSLPLFPLTGAVLLRFTRLPQSSSSSGEEQQHSREEV